MAKLLTLQFSRFFLLKLLFYPKISFSLQKEEDFWKKKQDGQVTDLWWPSYWPYSIYIYAVEFKQKLVQELGFYKLKTRPSLKLKTGPSFSLIFRIFVVFWGMFKNTNRLCQNSVLFAKLSGCQNEVFEKKIACFVSFLCWRQRNRKKEKNTKWRKAKKPIK